VKKVKEFVDLSTLRLLSMLYQDSRTPYRKLGRRLGVTAVTCYNKVMKLRRLGVIRRYSIEVDAAKLGYPIKALIEIKASKGLSSVVAEKTFKIKHVVRVYEITGEKDAIIEAYFRSIDDLNQFLKDIRNLCPEILETVTHIVLNMRENPHGWWLDAKEAEQP